MLVVCYVCFLDPHRDQKGYIPPPLSFTPFACFVYFVEEPCLVRVYMVVWYG